MAFGGENGTQVGGVVNGGGSAVEWLADPGQLVSGVFGKKKGGNSTPVGDAYAALMRDQWYTYVNTFVPIENKLIEYATSPTVVSDAMASASTDTTNAFDAAQAGAARRLRGMGVTLDADEQAASDKSYGLAKSLADVSAQNTAGAVARQRQQSILGNPAPDAIQI
jgi:hypothetical protein